MGVCVWKGNAIQEGDKTDSYQWLLLRWEGIEEEKDVSFHFLPPCRVLKHI